MHSLDDQLHLAAEIWRDSDHAVALTGAGISVGSGIPDFRSPGGLWTRFNPMEVATLTALRANPKRVWEFLVEAALTFGTSKPNPAHTVLAEMEEAGKLDAVITQNIDNLHREAGSKQVVEFHGNGMRFYCMRCKENKDPDLVKDLAPEDLPWTCHCGGVIRPDFVFFGEQIPARAMAETTAHVANADLMLIVGTSGEVSPANSLPHQVKRRGGRVIEINYGSSAFGSMPDAVLRAKAEEALPLLRELVLG